MKAATKQVNIMNLEVGNIVHAHGARFEVVSVTLQDETDTDRAKRHPQYMRAASVWLDGADEGAYFGPNQKNWTLQGNSNVVHDIEA